MYDHKKIEAKWQKEWEKNEVYKAKDDSEKPKFYALVEFPYPSGEGLHVGHPRPYIGLDLVARKRRMEGFNVLYPMGWDAFGLPTENYAIKTGIQPATVTKNNTDNFRRQIKLLGTSFDWSREINTTDPKYYKWTQWLFLQFLKHDLAYKAKIDINWCPKDKIGLANEEVVNGCCERCGTPVEKREKEQWMLRITKYADKLYKDLDTVDYSEKIKLAQRNWIGKSEGTELSFELRAKSLESENLEATSRKFSAIKVFTTRADTLFGVTYLVVAPEHPWLTQEITNTKSQITNKSEIQNYIKETKNKTEIERTNEKKEKTGVKLEGVTAINPANGEEIPVFVADYVLGNYGTGAVMAVPAHDERDFEFAQKYELPIKQVIAPYFTDPNSPFIEGKEIVFRKVVHSIIVNPKNNKILGLEWRKFPWNTFVIGGIEGNETNIEAALREIREETGYKNLKFIKKLAGPFINEFYAAHKDINRTAQVDLLLFELIDEDKDIISEEENSKHSIKWVEKSELRNFIKGIDEKDYEIEVFERGEETCFVGEGSLVNSPNFELMKSEEAREKITEKFGKKVVKFKLRDWVFSRQRYWGEPIPVVHCSKCGIVPLSEKDLPLELPEVKKYQPTDDGESPLASIESWVKTKCPKCNGEAKRETDTMPNWAGSSWYFLRYTDPHNNQAFASPQKLKYWTPVDWYNGGMEHTTLHLLYSRFWNKFFYDIGLVPTSEPYKKRTSHGFILGADGEKMSKSRGNVINPDDVIGLHGADTLRLYEMFMGPFDQMIAWSDNNIIGVRRFIEKIWRLVPKISSKKEKVDRSFEALLHKTVKKVGDDIESMSFNTAVSSMMILVNEMEKMTEIPQEYFEIFLKLLAPFAPHLTEEIWENLGHKTSIHLEEWPKFDKSKIKEEKTILVIQINGKVRAQFEAETGISEKEAKEKALALPDVQKWLENREIKKVIFVPNKVISFVV